MVEIKALVFDLDGTLIDSKIDFEEMSNRVKSILLSAGIPEDDLTERQQVYRFILGWEAAFTEYDFSSGMLKKILVKMNKAINEVEMDAIKFVKIMPNAYKMLKKLNEMDLLIGIATRGSHLYSAKSLELTELSKFVKVILARDQVRFPKPDPRHLLKVIKQLNAEPEETIFIGDTVTDYTTAGKAGVSFYAYKRDERRVKRLVDAGCSCFLEDLYEIIDIINKKK